MVVVQEVIEAFVGTQQLKIKWTRTHHRWIFERINHSKNKWVRDKDRFPLHRGNLWLCNRQHKEGWEWVDGGFLNKIIHMEWQECIQSIPDSDVKVSVFAVKVVFMDTQQLKKINRKIIERSNIWSDIGLGKNVQQLKEEACGRDTLRCSLFQGTFLWPNNNRKEWTNGGI